MKTKLLTEKEFLKQKDNFFTGKEIKKILAQNGYKLSTKAISSIAKDIGAKYYYDKLQIVLYSEKILEIFNIKN